MRSKLNFDWIKNRWWDSCSREAKRVIYPIKWDHSILHSHTLSSHLAILDMQYTLCVDISHVTVSNTMIYRSQLSSELIGKATPYVITAHWSEYISTGIVNNHSLECFKWRVHYYPQLLRRTLIGNKIDHLNVVRTSPVGAAPTTSSFWLQLIRQNHLQDETRKKYFLDLVWLISKVWLYLQWNETGGGGGGAYCVLVIVKS